MDSVSFHLDVTPTGLDNGHMATIQLRNLPEDMHAQLKTRAKARNQSMTQYLTDLLRRDLDKPSLEDWLEENRRANAGRPPIEISVEEMMQDTRPWDGRS
ncbi:MAG: hypothetical protein LBL01_03310 [Bifidobacteriaceae bacterium]|nr:hypothetical protein [Bifidobacteriaceae bacterium]